MHINRISSMSFPVKFTFIPKPEIKQYIKGDYLLTVEIFPDKQIRTVRNIKENRVISREIIHNLC